MIHTIIITLITSSLLYVLRPRMPLYHVTSLQIIKFKASLFPTNNNNNKEKKKKSTKSKPNNNNNNNDDDDDNNKSISSLISYYWKNLNVKLSASVLAGIQVDNTNFVGVDLYKAYVHIYYPDWYGTLDTIGILKEVVIVEDEGVNNDNNNDNDDDGQCLDSYANQLEIGAIDFIDHNHNHYHHHNKKSNDNHRGVCISSPTSKSKSQQKQKQQQQHPTRPFFSIKPRTTSKSNDKAISININDIEPRTYLNLFKNAIWQGGTIDIQVSGVAHVKSQQLLPLLQSQEEEEDGDGDDVTISKVKRRNNHETKQKQQQQQQQRASKLGIPLTIGLLCDNTVNFRNFPLEIVGKSCIIKGVMTGWVDLETFAYKLQDDTIKTYSNTGRLFDYNIDHNKKKKMMKKVDGIIDLEKDEEKGKEDVKDDSLGSLNISPEMIEDWHVF